MHKRGQVTIFIILGIIIILVIGLFLALTKKTTTAQLVVERETSLAAKVTSVKLFVQDCLEQTSQEAIFFTSEQGGYYSTPAPYYEFAFFEVPYYFDQKILLIPNKKMMERELEEYIKTNIGGCLNEFKLFHGEVSGRDNSVNVTISKNNVVSVLNTDITIRTDDASTHLNTFTATIPAELGLALEIRDLILEEQEKYPQAVRISELAILTQQYPVLIDLAEVENTVIYKIRFPESPYDPGGYIYTFAMKYNWANNQLNLK